MPFGRADDALFASETGHLLSTNSARQRLVNKSVALANSLLARARHPRDRSCHAAHDAVTEISLLLAAGFDPAYVMAQVGHTDPTLTLPIYKQLLKRRRREESRERVNELLGTSRQRPARSISTPTRFSIPTGTSNHGGDSGQPYGFAGLYLRADAGTGTPDPLGTFQTPPHAAPERKTAKCSGFLEPTRGLEPLTPSLPWRCSTS
jgi:hypothetical protein